MTNNGEYKKSAYGRRIVRMQNVINESKFNPEKCSAAAFKVCSLEAVLERHTELIPEYEKAKKIVELRKQLALQVELALYKNDKELLAGYRKYLDEMIEAIDAQENMYFDVEDCSYTIYINKVAAMLFEAQGENAQKMAGLTLLGMAEMIQPVEKNNCLEPRYRLIPRTIDILFQENKSSQEAYEELIEPVSRLISGQLAAM